jgi:phospholipid transport system substrate-binding protein
MTLKKNLIVCWTIAIVLSIPFVVYASAPIDFVKTNGEEILKVLRDNALSQQQKVDQLSALAENIFFFDEMAKMTLARHWSKRSEEEKKEFVALYKEFLKKTYARKINKYSGEKVVYLSESVEPDGKFAIVKTKVINEKKNVETPVDYKLKLDHDNWRVYDIVAEGISLISNYRSQFNEIVTSSSYQELLKKMNDKIKEADVMEGS